MTRKFRAALAVAGLAVALGAAAPARADSIWKPVSLPAEVGATSTITAVEYQSESRFWFATQDGKIFKRQGDGTFVKVFDEPTLSFTDIEFQKDGGQVGLAVGQNGAVVRTQAGGETGSWTQLPGSALPASNTPYCNTDTALTNVISVRFARPNRAFLLTDSRQYLRSKPDTTADNVGAPGTWEDLNRTPGNTCRTDRAFGDAFFLSAGSNLGGYFAGPGTSLYTEASGTFEGAFANRPVQSCWYYCRITGDPAAGNRQWAVDGAYLRRTTDNWASYGPVTGVASYGPFDVVYVGGTVVTAGSAGAIYTATDDATFYSQKAAAPNDTVNWTAVSGYDANHFAVGGDRGALVITDNASFTPDVVAPVINAISGPTQVTAGQTAGYAVDVSDAGGFDPSGVAWTASGGLPSQAGDQVSFTFPTAGSYTLRVTVTDRAGNVSKEKALTVSVSNPPATDTRVEPTFAFAGPGGKPKVATVKKGGKVYIVITVAGSLKVPAGVDRAVACNGAVTMNVTNSKRLITSRKGKINAHCGYKKVVRFRKGKLRGKKVAVRVIYAGNAYLRGFEATARITLKKQV